MGDRGVTRRQAGRGSPIIGSVTAIRVASSDPGVHRSPGSGTSPAWCGFRAAPGLDLFEAQPARVLDHDAHQLPADAVALEVGADQDAVLAALVIGVGVQAHRPQHVAGLGGDGHQRDRTGVVELGQPGDEFVAEMLHRLEEAQPQVFVGDAGEEGAEQRIVFWAHRAHQRVCAIAQADLALPFLGVWENGKARMAAPLVQLARRRHRHTGVQRDHTVAVGQQRVDVQLGDFGDVGGQLRQLDQHQRHRALVGGRHVAVGLENARDAGAADQLVGQAQVQRWQRELAVVDDFNRGAAAPEHDRRAEHRVVGDAGDQFARLRPQHGGLHDQPFDHRAGMRAARTRQDAGGRFAHRSDAGEIQAHTAHIGLVRDLAGQHLQGDRAADRQ